MVSNEINVSGKKRRLRFMEPSAGTEEFTSFFREGAIRFLLPTTTIFAATYIVISTSIGIHVSALSFILVSVCGATYGLSLLGFKKFALRLFIGGGFLLVWALNYPILAKPNGFATGGAYLFCLYPITWWMCFAERKSRMAMLAATILALFSIAFAGQPEESLVQVPHGILLLGLVRSLFILAITMGMGHAIEVSIKRYGDRWQNGLAQQKALTLAIQNQKRNLEREANAHQKTLVHLTRSENRYRKLFDNAFDGIVIYDGNKDKPIEINSTFCKVLGYTKEQMFTSGPVQISPAHQADGTLTTEHRVVIKEKLDAGEDLRYPWRHVSRYGAIIDFEIYTFRIPGEDNIRVSVMRDVTVQNRTQLAVEEANRELRTFAHAASHDLKEPLRTMSNFAKLIDRRYADKLDDNGREYIKYINDAASRGTTLVTDLLRFAEVGTDQITTEIVSLNQVAATVKQTVNARLEEEGATLIIDDLPEVIATPTWTQQLLQNLISNALKFKRDDVIPEVHVFAKAVDSSYEIHVKDNGIGIAEENLAKVFGVFERLNLREKFEGNGIGLALCQRIMKKLGGSIRVESTFGVGTTFILSFPMLSPEPAQANCRKVEA